MKRSQTPSLVPAPLLALRQLLTKGPSTDPSRHEVRISEDGLLTLDGAVVPESDLETVLAALRDREASPEIFLVPGNQYATAARVFSVAKKVGMTRISMAGNEEAFSLTRYVFVTNARLVNIVKWLAAYIFAVFVGAFARLFPYVLPAIGEYPANEIVRGLLGSTILLGILTLILGFPCAFVFFGTPEFRRKLLPLWAYVVLGAACGPIALALFRLSAPLDKANRLHDFVDPGLLFAGLVAGFVFGISRKTFLHPTWPPLHDDGR